jgi:tape measure domain-containing protein
MSDIKTIIELLLKDEKYKASLKENQKQTKKTKEETGKLKTSVGKLKAGYLLLAGVIGGTFVAAIGKAIKKAGEFQQTQIAFTTILGGNEKAAKALIAQLEEFANTTPFLTDEVVKAGRSLLAFGIEANKVTPFLRRIGDISAGVNAPLGELAEIIGKARVQNQLFAEDINQLTGRGIPVIDEFAKILGVSASQVKKLGSEGKISFSTLEKAIENMTSKGGQFFELTDKQSKSFLGQVSTLQSEISILARRIGEILIPIVEKMVKALRKITGVEKNLTKVVGSVNAIIQSFKILWALVTAFFKGFSGLVNNFLEGFTDIGRAVKALATGNFKEWFAVADNGFQRMKDTAVDVGSGLKDSFTSAFKSINDGFKVTEKTSKETNQKILDDYVKTNAKKVEVEGLTLKQIKELNKLHDDSIEMTEEEKLQSRIDKLNALVEGNRLTNEQLKLANDTRRNYEEQQEEMLKEKRIQNMKDVLSFNSKTTSSIDKLNQQIFNNRITRLENEKAAIDAKLEQELISEEEATKRKKELDNEILKGKRKAAIATKAAALAQALINIPLAISSTYAQSFGGPITRGVFAGIAGGIATLNAAAVAKQPIPQFAKGIDMLGNDTLAMVHKGERIIPAAQNIAGISNTDFVSAAMSGLGANNLGGGASNISNVTETTNNDNRVMNFNGIKDINAFRNELLRMEGQGAFT